MAIDAPDARRTVSLRELPGLSDLVLDYLYDHERVARFYGGDPRQEEAYRLAVDRAAAANRPREEMSTILVDQNRAWEMPEAVIENAKALASPDSVAIVTGQQVGIFGGPLYTIYKTISAIGLAEKLRQETGKPVVPVFWVEGEDHDFDEIASFNIFFRNEVRTLTYGAARPENPGPVGRLPLGEDVTRLLDELAELLPPSDFHDGLMEALRDAYRPDRSIEEGFVHWWKHLFARFGLVFMNPDDERMKRLTVPLFEREIRASDEAARRVADASRDLVSSGYHAQVNTRPTNLFLLHEAGRLPLDLDGDGVVLRGRDDRYSVDELVDLLHEQPERFSPNVILRPLMQDFLLPTACYVAGPGEIAYFAQYRGVYEQAEIPMPVIHPRATATLLETKVEKVLDRYELSIGQLSPGLEPAFAEVVRRLSEHDLEQEFGSVLKSIHEGINTLKPVIEDVDRNLTRTAEATRASLVKEVERLKERVFRAEKRRHDEVRTQLEKAHINIFPGGRLQERVISPIYFLNKFGFGLIDRLFEALDPAERNHHVLSL